MSVFYPISLSVLFRKVGFSSALFLNFQSDTYFFILFFISFFSLTFQGK